MEIRPARSNDLDRLIEIDGTVHSSHYLHIDRIGEGPAIQWRLEERPLRQPFVERNRPSDDDQFQLKNIVTGIDEGMALLAEHDDAMVALLVAQPQAPYQTMKVLDLRVDSDFRRQGLATAMLYQTIAEGRSRQLRAVTVECRANNMPANRLLAKLGFELAGLDTQRHGNHDLVKEMATLFWYAALD